MLEISDNPQILKSIEESNNALLVLEKRIDAWWKRIDTTPGSKQKELMWDIVAEIMAYLDKYFPQDMQDHLAEAKLYRDTSLNKWNETKDKSMAKLVVLPPRLRDVLLSLYNNEPPVPYGLFLEQFAKKYPLFSSFKGY